MSHDEQQPVDTASAPAGPVISVIVYTRNDAATIKWCLDSLTDQERTCDFEVLVVDDCSSDGTPEIIYAGFPEFALIRQEQTRGWVVSVRRALTSAQGRTLAFLGAHCSAGEGWVKAVIGEMSTSRQVITGMGTHGEERFLARFEALSVHSDFLGTREREVAFLWDDNFAIRPAILRRGLPDSDRYLSDGAGAALLSLELKRLGIPIHYRPALQIDHATHSLGTLIRFWYVEMAKNAVAIKLADRSLPWARRLWLGPVAAAALAAGRFLQGLKALLRSRHILRMSLPEMGLHCCLFACLTPIHFLGLCREIVLVWKEIRPGPRPMHELD